MQKQLQNSSNIIGMYLSVYPHPLDFLSGGEKHYMEVLKVAKDTTIFTAYPGTRNIKNNKVKAKVIDLTTYGEKLLSKNGLGLGLVYINRIVKSIPHILKLPRRRYLVLCSCHYFADIIPALLLKLVRPGSKVTVYLHHLSPHWLIRCKYHPLIPSLLTWFNQRLAVYLIRFWCDLVFTYGSIKDDLIGVGIQENKIKETYCGV